MSNQSQGNSDPLASQKTIVFLVCDCPDFTEDGVWEVRTGQDLYGRVAGHDAQFLRIRDVEDIRSECYLSGCWVEGGHYGQASWAELGSLVTMMPKLRRIIGLYRKNVHKDTRMLLQTTGTPRDILFQTLL